MAHGHTHEPIHLIEKFELPAKTRTYLIAALVLGVVLVIMGALWGMSHEVAPTGDHGEAAHGGHHSPIWVTQLWAAFLMNNVYFVGVAVLAIFFIAVSNVTDAGWYIMIKRIPEAMGNWLYVGLILMAIGLVGAGNLYHWWDPAVVAADEILSKKASYLNQNFFVIRFIVIFAIWITLFALMRQSSKREDANGGLREFHRTRTLSVVFVILFALSFSVFAWDSIMSLDPHWFSTMFGVYLFATSIVSAFSIITMIAIYLKRAGYLPAFNDSHLHDLGKFTFAFSIFWAYITFCQFMLIWYANIPEETAYFYARWIDTPYFYWFLSNFLINLVFPLLMLMSAGSKRNPSWLTFVCLVLAVGHYIDIWLMVTPSVLQNNGTFGLVEIGAFLVYGSAFLLVTAAGLSRASLVSKNHPYFRESLEHNYV
jgi:hypothetical protein